MFYILSPSAAKNTAGRDGLQATLADRWLDEEAEELREWCDPKNVEGSVQCWRARPWPA
jgi:hypothetical protein